VGKFAEIWREAAADLGLEIVAPCRLVMPDKSTLEFHVLLKNFGYENGILLGDDYENARPYKEHLLSTGYAYSFFGPYADSETYDRESVMETLADWGWSGPAAEKPDWLPPPPDDADWLGLSDIISPNKRAPQRAPFFILRCVARRILAAG
jgi:hypothetical protein